VIYDKNKIAGIVQKEFVQKKIMVIGDLIVDEYVIGSVKRISPEAPVPVLYYKEVNQKAGGASNVAHNVKALGGNVFLSGVAAMDRGGMWLRTYMRDINIGTQGIVAEEGRDTIVKTRVATKGQQLLRIDREKTECIAEQTQKNLVNSLENKIDQLNAVILSDYQKGVLDNPEFIKTVIKICNENSVLVLIDSKKHQISSFQNADIVKPNNLELEEAVGISIVDDASLNEAGKLYLERSGAKSLVVTRGYRGISVFLPGKERVDFPAVPAQVYDVTGAGDTVISTIALGLSSGLSLEETVWLANVAAAIVISKLGTSVVTGKELIEKIYEN